MTRRSVRGLIAPRHPPTPAAGLADHYDAFMRYHNVSSRSLACVTLSLLLLATLARHRASSRALSVEFAIGLLHHASIAIGFVLARVLARCVAANPHIRRTPVHQTRTPLAFVGNLELCGMYRTVSYRLTCDSMLWRLFFSSALRWRSRDDATALSPVRHACVTFCNI